MFSQDDAIGLATLLAEGNSSLESRLTIEAEKGDIFSHQPMLTHEGMLYLRDLNPGGPPAKDAKSLLDAMRTEMMLADVPQRVSHYLTENDLLCEVLEQCGIELTDSSLNKIRDDYILSFIRSVGWIVEEKGRLINLYQTLREAWKATKERRHP